MFLHIGENISIYKKDIIAILDKKTVEKSKDTKIFLEKLNTKNTDKDKIKTYLIVLEDGEYSLYTSNIASITLLNRK